MKKILKDKKILVTAGPVWVPIDAVRVITNTFGGALGYIIAETAYRYGASVTLLMGPGRVHPPKSKKRFRVVRFKYFNEILQLVKEEVGSREFDCVIHSAAIADYQPASIEPGKIKSGNNNLIISLRPTIKIVDFIKDLDPSIFLVKFKLEVNREWEELIDIAYRSMLHSKADLIVANDYSTVNTNHKAYIINPDRDIQEYTGKDAIAENLLKVIAEKL